MSLGLSNLNCARPLLFSMTDFTPLDRPTASAAAEAPTLAALPATPASCVAAAAQLAPRLLAQAAATDEVGGFPAQEMRWLHEAGLLAAEIGRAHV